MSRVRQPPPAKGGTRFFWFLVACLIGAGYAVQPGRVPPAPTATDDRPTPFVPDRAEYRSPLDEPAQAVGPTPPAFRHGTYVHGYWRKDGTYVNGYYRN